MESIENSSKSATTVLVTGGAGYIGSHTTVELLEQGYDVVIIDNLSNSSIDVLDRIEKITNKKPRFYQFDICDETRLKQFFIEEKNVSAIIHFAAFKAVGESVENPLKYYHNNIFSLVNLLSAVKNYPSIKSFVFSSSCTVYGQPDALPVTEQSPFKAAESPYGYTKQVGEEILKSTSSTINFPIISLRYFNPIGAHASALIGELPNGVPSNLVPFITQTAIGKREVLSVFGNDYTTPDGSCIRDFIHVVDLAKAHVIAIERMLNKKNKSKYEVFNIGTGTGYSVLQLIECFIESTQVKINYKIVGRRAGDVEKIYADTQLANNELGWKAQLNLPIMLQSAWNWEKFLASL